VKYFAQIGERILEIEIENPPKADGRSFRITLNGKSHLVDFIEIEPGRFSLIIDGRQNVVRIKNQKDSTLVMTERGTLEVLVRRGVIEKERLKVRGKRGEEIIRAPMPGLVVGLKIKEGKEVRRGEVLLILEAMKMQNEIRSPVNGKVSKVLVEEGKTVDKGERLVVLETG